MSRVYITEFDKVRLTRLFANKRYEESDIDLVMELNRRKLVKSKNVAPDVITINSEIRFSDEYGDDWLYRLVFPKDADLTKNKISVLSPIGWALLGKRVGNRVTLLKSPMRKKLIIKEIVYQPEREGHFEL